MLGSPWNEQRDLTSVPVTQHNTSIQYTLLCAILH